MRHLLVTGLMLCIGAFFTWIAATALETYELRQNTAAHMTATEPDVATATKSVDQHWMF